MSASQCRVCATVCLALLVIIAAGLVGGSFGFLQPDELGIVQNTVAKGIDDTRVYTGGRYFLGLGRGFLVYPTTVQNIYFATSSSSSSSGAPDAAPLIVRVPQGQVTLEASLQYRLSAASLIPLYRNFQADYHRRFVTLAASTVQTALQLVDVDDFYDNRTLVQTLAVDALTTAFASQYAVFDGFQLRRVSLPPANEAQVLQKLQSEVRQRTAAIVQTQQAVDAATTVLVGEIDQEIVVLVANKTNEAAVVTSAAAADATAARLTAESGAFGAFTSAVGFNSSQLLRYLYYRSLWDAPGARVVAGFDAPTGLV